MLKSSQEFSVLFCSSEMLYLGCLVLPFRGAATIDDMASCPVKSQIKSTKLLSVGVRVGKVTGFRF